MLISVTAELKPVKVDAGNRLCGSNSLRDMRNLLNQLGLNGNKYTEKSFKVAGVTAATEVGMSLEDIAFHGRWLSTESPKHYRKVSAGYRTNVAEKIPLS